MSAVAAIAVDGLTVVSPAGTTLLRDAAFEVPAGKVLLIAGPSGSGKSTLVRVLGGLLGRGAGWRISGTLRWPGGTVDLARARSNAGGLVFQNHALFDDLTALENLLIVADHHRRSELDLVGAAEGVLADIDPDQAINACSGGQRQRLAIARTLLSDPAILLFDEPNSGLDIRSSRWLAAMIGDVCRRSGKPAIIVAHHVDAFLDLADQVLVLDPANGRLRAVAVDRAAIEAVLTGQDPAGEPAAPAMPRPSWPPRLPHRGRSHWFLRYLRAYLWLLFASPLTLLYVALGAGIVGFVTIWFGFSYHSFGGYLRAILHDETLEGLGFVLAAVAVPFNTCILVVARNSAIIAADLGSRVAGSQFQAIRNLRLPGRVYIVAAILISLAIGSLVLVAVALLTAFAASLVTWHWLFPGQPSELFQELFFRKILEPRVLAHEGFWVVLKVMLSTVMGGGMAVVVTLVARPPDNGQVTSLIASSIVGGVSVTLLVHAVVMMLQFAS